MAETVRLDDSAAGVARAAALLRDGALVSFPTETVYGLGADATNDRAVARIFEAKGRPRFNPLIVHLPDVAAAQGVALLEGDALRLADAFWPGPLTLVLPRRDGGGLSRLVSAGLPTVAVRVPDHALAHRLLAETGRPVAAPSANPSGKISPTEASHVLAGLSGRIAAVLDGGACPVGVEIDHRRVCARVGWRGGPGAGAAASRRAAGGSDRGLSRGAAGGAGGGRSGERAGPARLALRAARAGAAGRGGGRARRTPAGVRAGGRCGAEPVAVGRSRRGGGEFVSPPACARPGRGRTDRGVADPRARARAWRSTTGCDGPRRRAIDFDVRRHAGPCPIRRRIGRPRFCGGGGVPMALCAPVVRRPAGHLPNKRAANGPVPPLCKGSKDPARPCRDARV